MIVFHIIEIVFRIIAGTNILYDIGLPLLTSVSGVLRAVFRVTLAQVSLSTLVLGVAPSEDKPRHHVPLRAAHRLSPVKWETVLSPLLQMRRLKLLRRK